jgi:hypothetical protein
LLVVYFYFCTFKQNLLSLFVKQNLSMFSESMFEIKDGINFYDIIKNVFIMYKENIYILYINKREI